MAELRKYDGEERCAHPDSADCSDTDLTRPPRISCCIWRAAQIVHDVLYASSADDVSQDYHTVVSLSLIMT